MKKPQVKIGDVLFFAVKYGHNHHVTVTKVGRKWVFVNFNNGTQKFCIETWKHYSETMPLGHHGKLYLSEQDFAREIELENEWIHLRRRVKMASSRPGGVTSETIAKLIGEMGNE